MSHHTSILLTFRTYGSWLHGDPRGSVDSSHNTPGTPRCASNPSRQAQMRRRMRHPPFSLSTTAKNVVQTTVIAVCSHRLWSLGALAVEDEHVHLLVSDLDRSPEAALSMLKAWATRRLTEAACVARGRRVWSEHGSTRWIQGEECALAAQAYVEAHAGAVVLSETQARVHAMHGTSADVSAGMISQP